ncbi:hypothetical protein [Actinokineospora sp.]|uniref:hypothetical protein n=1 Tax=Actinokineospora sp. TaxID=1872133 RepID=UPI003D6A1049
MAHDAGIRVITLTNGSATTTSSLLERTGLRGQVEQVVRGGGAPLETRTRAGPARRRGLRRPARSGGPGRRARLGHPRRASSGTHTGWVSRPEGHWNDLFEPPDVTGPDLVSVVRALLELGDGPDAG